jgi:hypothetical protein
MEKLYIARKFVAIEGSARHIYEEEIFDSYEAAFKFIKSISEEEEDFFLSEIVSCVLNDVESCNEKENYIFDKKGDLVWSNNVSKSPLLPDSFVGKFSIGEIVKLCAFPWDPFSPTYVSTIGVVSQLPVSLDEWLMGGNDKNHWDNNYVVEYIRDGYLGHWHVKECSLESFRQELPDKLQFLQILAAHYLELKILPEKIYKDIQCGNVFIEKVEHLNFDIFKKGG